LLKRRRTEYCEVFKTFVEEEETLASLYGPLRERLREAVGTLGKLEFVVQREVKLQDWLSEARNCLTFGKHLLSRSWGLEDTS